MELNNLKPAKGSINKNSQRIGRGQGSGKGGTATRGHKGAKSRSGYSKKLGFEDVKLLRLNSQDKKKLSFCDLILWARRS